MTYFVIGIREMYDDLRFNFESTPVILEFNSKLDLREFIRGNNTNKITQEDFKVTVLKIVEGQAISEQALL